MSQNYFAIPPTSVSDESFERIWEFDRQNSTIAIGWGKTGELAGMTKEEIASAYDTGYPDRAENKYKRASDLKNICTFYLDINQGDIIIARKGLTDIIGIGKVTRTAFYDKDLSTVRNDPYDHATPHFIGVDWVSTGRHSLKGRIRSQSTVRQIYEEEYDSYGISIKDGLQSEDPSNEIEFSREGILETFIVEHLDEVFGNKYELYEDEIS